MGEIQPTEFDLIVVGTGFQEALIAGCAAKAGKTVLHLDQADYYGSHWASLSLDQFLQWAAQASSNSREQATVTPAPNDTPVVSSAPSTPVEGGSQQQTAATKEPAPEQPDGRAGAQDNADAQYATLPTSAAKDQTFAPVGSALSSGLYSNFSLERAAGADLDASRDYNIDLAPKVVYCCGPMIDLLLSCGAQNYLEFKLVQGSYMWREGKLRQVPCSRADVFKDRSLGPLDKRLLMRFLKNAVDGIQGQGSLRDAFGEQPFVQLLGQEGLPACLREFVMYAIALIDHDQEVFVERKASPAASAGDAAASDRRSNRQGSAAVDSSLLGAVSTAGTAQLPVASLPEAQPPERSSAPQAPQEATSGATQHIHESDSAEKEQGHAGTSGAEQAIPGRTAVEPSPGSAASEPIASCSQAADSIPAAVTAADAKARMALYLQSMGRYGTGTGAFLTPLYGCGELPQAFCRVAAVHSALYVLRQQLAGLLLDAQGRRCIAIKTGPGQVLKCKALAAHADVLSGLLPGSASQAGSRVSRALCILDGSLQEGESSVMVAIPPRALGGSNPHAIRVLQLGAPTLVAPSNRYLLHLSTPSAAVTAAEDLRQAVETLVQPPPRALNPDNHPDTASSSGASPLTSLRPKALLVAYYKQSMPSLASLDQLPANVTCCSGPDHTAEIGSAVKGAAALYARLFPGDPDMLSQGALGTNAGDESDDEAVEALEGVLQGLSTRTGGSANGTTD